MERYNTVLIVIIRELCWYIAYRIMKSRWTRENWILTVKWEREERREATILWILLWPIFLGIAIGLYISEEI